MQYFDYKAVAREAKIPPEKMEKLLALVRQEFPNDTLMYELHALRVCMAIKDGYIDVDDVLKNKPEDRV